MDQSIYETMTLWINDRSQRSQYETMTLWINDRSQRLTNEKS